MDTARFRYIMYVCNTVVRVLYIDRLMSGLLMYFWIVHRCSGVPAGVSRVKFGRFLDISRRTPVLPSIYTVYSPVVSV